MQFFGVCQVGTSGLPAISKQNFKSPSLDDTKRRIDPFQFV